MENASKALIMAAGILLGIMLLSLAVYLFTLFGDFSKNQTEEIFRKSISEFNSQYTVYETRTDIMAQDIVTVANLAQNSNQYYGLTKAEKNNFYITIICDGQSMEKGTIDKNEFIRINAVGSDGRPKYYTCSTQTNSTTGRVNKVTFSKR